MTITIGNLGPRVSFAENAVNAAPRLLDTSVTLAPTRLVQAKLSVIGLRPEDRVALADFGSMAGQIGIDGSTVRYGGVAIGTAMGGIGDSFVVTFLPVVPVAAIEASIEALTFATVSDTPTPRRGLIIQLYDPTNGTGAGFLDVTVVPENDAPTGRVTLSVEGGTLRATAALADQDGLGSVALRWQHRDGDWQDLGGAGPDLAIAPGMSGLTLRAVASYVDGGGTAEEVASASLVRFGTRNDDRLVAEGDGGDLLLGRRGADLLAGGAGADTLLGGAGGDTLHGGSGTDAFRFLSRREGGDVIEDFTPGEDRIELRGVAFGGLDPGPLAASHFVIGMPTAAWPQVVYDPADGSLRFDPDGTGRKPATVIAVLGGAPAVEAADILVIA